MKSLRTIGVGENYMCNLCEKSFKHKIHLNRHVEIHKIRNHHITVVETNVLEQGGSVADILVMAAAIKLARSSADK